VRLLCQRYSDFTSVKLIRVELLALNYMPMVLVGTLYRDIIRGGIANFFLIPLIANPLIFF
jgi:hypothetical protein